VACSSFSLLRSSSDVVSSASESLPPSSRVRATATRTEMLVYRLATFQIPLARSSTVGLFKFRRFFLVLRTNCSYFRFSVSYVSCVPAPLLSEGRCVGELGLDMADGCGKRVNGASFCAVGELILRISTVFGSSLGMFMRVLACSLEVELVSTVVSVGSGNWKSPE